jgi:hypothetical protein
VAARILFCAVTLAAIVLAPVIVLVGEPLRRYYLRGLRRNGDGWRRHGLARVVIANPVLIALTAPGRWAMNRVAGPGPGDSGRGGFGWRRGRGGGGWPPTGTREPRRPKPAAPAGAVALAEPRPPRRFIRIRLALPPAFSKPVRRVGSHLRRIAGALRTRARHRLA